MDTTFSAEPLTLRQVVEEEAKSIRHRRGHSPDGTDSPEAGGRPPDLCGLALSGGGIRSATFCLGVLQAFHARGLLSAFDYLSTVSGGGFVGGWLMAWLARGEANVGFPLPERVARGAEVAGSSERAVKAGEARADADDPIHHLRRFSNYLTPRKGLLSGDTWRAATVVTRNLALTWAVLLPILFGLLLLGHLYFVTCDPTWLASAPGSESLVGRLRLIAIPIGALAGWLVVLTAVWLHFGRDRRPVAVYAPYLAISIVVLVVSALARTPYQGPVRPGELISGSESIVQWPPAFATWLVSTAPGIGCLIWFLASIALWKYATRRSKAGKSEDPSGGDTVRNQITRVHGTFLVILVATTFVLLLSGYAHNLMAFLLIGDRPRVLVREYVAAAGGWAVVISAVAGTLFTALKTAPTTTAECRSVETPRRVPTMVISVTPVLLLVVGGLMLAWAGRELISLLAQRTGPGSLRSLMLASSICFLLCGAYAWDEVNRERERWGTTGRWITLGAIWLGACTVVTLVVLRVDLPASSFAGQAVVAGLALLLLASAVLVAVAGTRARRREPATNTRPYWLLGFAYVWLAVLLFLGVPADSRFGTIRLTLAVISTVMAWALAVGWTVDPNLISLHHFYKSRLTRAYLGASNPKRTRDGRRITEADEGDDVPLWKVLDAVHRGAPYPLINTTLNLIGARDLATEQRRSDRFLLSPGFCGSSRTSYRPTREYMGGSLGLGTAVAVSGAAVSPVMGSLTPNAALTVVMALLNVRLGYWIPTPGKSRWRAVTATVWPWYMMKEVLSQTNDLSSYCYLTDGGHFDNTGVYSLIERCCRHIVFVDCGADPNRRLDDLAIVIRRCRIDFGTEVDIDLSALHSEQGPAEDRCLAAGRILYSDEHANRLGIAQEGREGSLTVIKPTMIPLATVDVEQYHSSNAIFPQQTTADQWFDEAQFESYRNLGESIAGLLFTHAKSKLTWFNGEASQTSEAVDLRSEGSEEGAGDQA